MDDIQDQSPLRRGNPATHLIFGIGQVINSACYTFVLCFNEAMKLSKPATSHFIRMKMTFTKLMSYRSQSLDEMQQLHIGQAYDLHWMYHCEVPTIEKYYFQAEQSRF